MSLISLSYMGLLGISFILYYCIPKRFRWMVLLVSSCVFYVSASGFGVLYLLISTISIYTTAILLDRQNKQLKEIKKLDKQERKLKKKKINQRKKGLVFIGLSINVMILLCLKYWNFFGGNFNLLAQLAGMSWHISSIKIILPLGISYYTLMALSYIVDVYRGKYAASYHLGKVALYLSFFPQMTEGPISRFDQSADALFSGNRFKMENIRAGCYLILWGIFKKMVIADRAAVFVNTVFSAPSQGWLSIVAIALYTLQIYAEFSAAMDIVRGSAWMFGIYLPQNFKRPFFSKSIAEFWRRWHITLGTWLKDYVFYSVSLSKPNMRLNRYINKHMKNAFGKFILMAFPLFFVWFGNGFWHGATWKYIFYGLYYYLIMMLGLLLQPLFATIKKRLNLDSQPWYKVFQILRTTLIVMIGMMIFRAETLSQAWSMLKGIVDIIPVQLFEYGLVKTDFFVLLLGMGMMFILSLYQEKGGDVQVLIDKKSLVLRYTIVLLLLTLIVIFGMYGKGYNASDFIYGGF